MRLAGARPAEQVRAMLSATVVAAALAIAPIPARADAAWSGDVPAKARTLADRGRAFHDAGEYAKAIAAFTQAYVMAPSPALLFNLAQAYRLQGNCDDAALMYRRYLASNPSPDERSLAETHLASVERCLHKIGLHIPIETAPTQLLMPTAPATLTATAPPPSRISQFEKDVGVGLGVGGGVALAVAGYYMLQARSAAADVADAYAMGAKWKDIAPIDERGKSAADRAKLFGAGGAIGVVGGVVMYLVGKHGERPPVVVSPTTRGAQVSVGWVF